jgi:hypothetical protein
MSLFKKHSDMSDKLKRNSNIPALKSLCAVREANKIKTGRSKLKTSISKLKEISNLWEGLKRNVAYVKSQNSSPVSSQKEKANKLVKSPTITANTKVQVTKAIYRANIDLTINTGGHCKQHVRVNSGNDLHTYDEECQHDLEILNKASLQKENAIKNYETLRQQFLNKYIYKHQQCKQIHK